jgi:hypothetical protein
MTSTSTWFRNRSRRSSGPISRLKTASISPPRSESRKAPDLSLRYEELARAGKPHQVEIYEGAYHDFCMGPQGHARKEPLLDATLDALEISVRFMAQYVKGEK